MNIVDMSCETRGTRRTVLTKTLVTQLVDICGDMWRVTTHAKSSHIMDKLVNVRQGLWNTPIKADLLLAILKTGLFDYLGSRLTKVLKVVFGTFYTVDTISNEKTSCQNTCFTILL